MDLLLKIEQDLHRIELVLHKCISLYKEPATRKFLSKVGKHDYIRCLRRLIGNVQSDFAVSQTVALQGLLAEAQQIMDEFGEETRTSN
ncbi:hypothetical protein GUJ93_ZPchr0015g6716 [Zizania palustris]|uniref:Uncharacterized protein n=1 Tax=Zizania palustris TaxID=103762 RepID=A0A8J5VSV4_ZIZPA|nr:hypothetical protein GUJ93_ZPchr0015g6716 [Zizania palustris]